VNFAAADAIAKTVLYEGYVLYPYRPSSIKNRQRWTFGGIYPDGGDGAETSMLHCECLVEGGAGARIEIRIRFLHMTARQVYAAELPGESAAGAPDDAAAFRKVESLAVNGQTRYTWEEAVEREICVPTTRLAELAACDAVLDFAFPASESIEPLCHADGSIRGRIVRSQAALAGRVSVCAMALGENVHRLSVRVDNLTPIDAERGANAQARALLSTHVLAGVEGGAFVSLIDPPGHLADAARACVNRGAWPVLVGPEGARDTLLCSPIILYDWPQVAESSPGDLFDGTEIDEILTLRILALSDAEKREMAATDEHARAVLARTEALTGEQMLAMHGLMRDSNADRAADPASTIAGSARADAAKASGPPTLASINDGARALRVGDPVRLKPRRGGDIFDLVLAGQTAVIESIEVDFDNRIHVAVTVDADPGREFGIERMPGHRFFFSPDEIDVLPRAGAA